MGWLQAASFTTLGFRFFFVDCIFPTDSRSVAYAYIVFVPLVFTATFLVCTAWYLCRSDVRTGKKEGDGVTSPKNTQSLPLVVNSKRDSNDNLAGRMWDTYSNIIVVFLFMLYPRMIQLCLEFVPCQDILGVPYAVNDMSWSCVDHSYRQWRVGAMGALCAVGVGVPLVYVIAVKLIQSRLKYKRQELKRQRNAAPNSPPPLPSSGPASMYMLKQDQQLSHQVYSNPTLVSPTHGPNSFALAETYGLHQQESPHLVGGVLSNLPRQPYVGRDSIIQRRDLLPTSPNHHHQQQQQQQSSPRLSHRHFLLPEDQPTSPTQRSHPAAEGQGSGSQTPQSTLFVEVLDTKETAKASGQTVDYDALVESVSVEYSTRFLWGCYRDGLRYWECVVMLRKVGVVSLITLLPLATKEALESVCVLLFFSLLIHVNVRPYRWSKVNSLEQISIFLSLVLAVLALAMVEGLVDQQVRWIVAITIFSLMGLISISLLVLAANPSWVEK